MARSTHKLDQRKSLVAIVAYIGLMLLVWPQVHTVAALPLKMLFALAPLVPMLYVIWLLARRIRYSDELEQRNHLVALGVATAVVGVLSLIVGFLAAAQVWRVDGSVLIWVFPAMMICYGISRWWVLRRYGVDSFCDDVDEGLPIYLRLLLIAGVIALVALCCWRSLGDERVAFLLGTALPLAMVGSVLALRRWRRRHHADTDSM